MIGNQLTLLRVQRFLPLFVTQFLGAFNDNLYKNALVIMITYQLSSGLTMSADVVITIAAGLFILPYFLFSALAGQLADKYEKATLIRYTKIAEILVMVLGAVGFYWHSYTLLLAVLFFLGVQATFFGPMKYSILPDHLHEDELIQGNALLEAGTYLAILCGMILGGVMAMFSFGPLLVSVTTLLFAIAGYFSSLSILPARRASPDLKINFNFISETKKIIENTYHSDQDLFLSIMGISWFWLIGATYISQIPTYVKVTLGAEASVVTLFLVCFTIGIAVGSLFCNYLLRGRIHATYVPIAALFMTIFAIDLVMASSHLPTGQGGLLTFTHFLSYFASWRLMFDLTMLAACGGVYSVPLYAMLQYNSEPSHRSRAVAANNIINALFMVISAIATSLLLFLHCTVTQIFLLIAIANFFVSIYICKLLPIELIRSFLISILKLMYRVEVKGLENYYKAGTRIVIIANHASLLDGVLLAVFLPDRLTIAIDTTMAEKALVRHAIKLVNAVKIDPTNPMSAKLLISLAKQDNRIVIFPEGRLTVTGAIMKIYEGPGLIADKANASILPIRIEGAQYSPFSYLKGKVRIRFFPKITLTILEPRQFSVPENIKGRERRKRISAKLYDLMTDMLFVTSDIDDTLFASLLSASKVHGKKHIVLEDVEFQPINYKKIILASFVLGRKISRVTKKNEYLGFMLPNSVGSVVTFFAMQAFHRVPAMINFSGGEKNVILACQTAQIKKVYTSRRFIQLAKLQHIVDAISKQDIAVIYLEDVKSQINVLNKLIGLLLSCFAETYYFWKNGIKHDDIAATTSKPAVILFTSGSEGAPKGVALSHQNLQANRFQAMARIDFNPTDKILNALPMFHAFGLNCGTLLPIVSGMRVFMYPSPLHYRVVPSIAYSINATLIFATNTFLNGYARFAHPYDFYSIRYVFAGAEKLQVETAHLWMNKFGIRILEGYGTTETGPVLAINTPMENQFGTVGRLLPRIEYQLQPVEGINEGGRLFVKGPNVMLGYMFSHAPAVIHPVPDRWHDTGDIVSINEFGFITILGRAKRFAKIAGEMVSLTAIEDLLYQLWPNAQHAVMNIPHERKGEQIILITSQKEATRHDILDHFRKKGLSELYIPSDIKIVLPKLPVLGSGKVDYQTLKAMFGIA